MIFCFLEYILILYKLTPLSECAG